MVENDSRASTGSVYLTCLLLTEAVHEVHIRIADHSDAYGRADYTADGIEGTVAGACEYLADYAAEHMDDHLDRLLRARKAWRRWGRLASAAGKCRMRGLDDTEAEEKSEAAWAAATAIVPRDDMPAEWATW